MLVTNTHARLQHLGEDATLLPGNNEVEPSVWAKWKKHPVIAFLLKSGGLVAAEESIADLSEHKPKAAVDLVEGTLDRNILATWQEQEKRPAVKKAIEKQLDKVAPPKPDEANAEE